MPLLRLMNWLPRANRSQDKLIVGMPLAGRYTAKNYDLIIHLLSATLTSWLNQTDTNFEIVIACNEIPDQSIVPVDKRISYIIAQPLERDMVAANPLADGWAKRYLLWRRIAELGPRYFFPMDADDLASCKLVEYVRKTRDPNGYLIRSGYVYDNQSKLFFLHPNEILTGPFDGLCGSSAMVTLETGEAGADSRSRWLEQILGKGHHEARAAFNREKRPAHEIPFPAVVYRINHGDNVYMRVNRNQRESFVDLIRKKCAPVDAESVGRVKREFSFEV
jgi:glycosyltransferase involved in cell wall biosynthesis